MLGTRIKCKIVIKPIRTLFSLSHRTNLISGPTLDLPHETNLILRINQNLTLIPILIHNIHFYIKSIQNNMNHYLTLQFLIVTKICILLCLKTYFLRTLVK